MKKAKQEIVVFSVPQQYAWDDKTNRKLKKTENSRETEKTKRGSAKKMIIVSKYTRILNLYLTNVRSKIVNFYDDFVSFFAGFVLNASNTCPG